MFRLYAKNQRGGLMDLKDFELYTQALKRTSKGEKYITVQNNQIRIPAVLMRDYEPRFAELYIKNEQVYMKFLKNPTEHSKKITPHIHNLQGVLSSANFFHNFLNGAYFKEYVLCKYERFDDGIIIYFEKSIRED
jgi:hypothetical protein